MGPAGTRARRLRRFVLLGGLSAFGPLSIDMYLPALPVIGRDLRAGESEVQLTLTACLVGLALGQAVAGPLSDTLGRRPPLLAGVAAYALVSLLCALAPSAPILVGLRLAQGLTGAAGIVVARAIVRDLFSGVAAVRYFSLLTLVMGLAPILAPVFGGQLLRFTTWHGVFVALAAIASLLFCGVAAGLGETLPAERRRGGSLRETGRTFWRLATDRGFIGYALSGGLAFGAMFAYISGSSFVLQETYQVTPQGFSLIFGLNALGLVLASQANGGLAGRVPPARLLAMGLSATAAGSLALLGVVLVGGLGLRGILPPLFVMVSSLGFVLPNATALALAGHPEAAGTGSALLGVLQNFIGAIAAPLVGIGGVASAVEMAAVIAVPGVGGILVLTVISLPRRGARRVGGKGGG